MKTMRPIPQSSSVAAVTRRERVGAAFRTIYPRLAALAYRLIRIRGVSDLEAADLCQDGALRAARYVYAFPDQRLDELDGNALEAILYSVAAQAMRSRLIDHIRRRDHRRRLGHLISHSDDLDRSFEAGREARATLNDMLAHSTDPCRRVLLAAAEVGDVDIALIVVRTGYSRAYVYRLLQALAETETKD